VLPAQPSQRVQVYNNFFTNSAFVPKCNETVVNPAPPAPSEGYFAGHWICPQRGWIDVTQSGGSVSGSIGGNPGEDFGSQDRNGGQFSGNVQGDTMSIIITHPADSTYTSTIVNLTGDGQGFSGKWEWYDTNTRVLKASGNWSCHR